MVGGVRPGREGEPAPALRAGHLRLVFAGTPTAALPALRLLLAEGRHEIVGVLTRPPKPAGRGRRPTPSPVHEAASAEGLAVLTPVSLRDPETQDRLAGLRPEAAAVVAYGQLVPRPALAIPGRGWVNLHFSLLPAWRGAAPVQRAILAGDDLTGATTFLLDEGLDTGPTLGTLTEPVRPRDTAGELLGRLAEHGARLLAATLDALAAGRAEPVPQPAEGVSHAPRLTVEEARLDWAAPAIHLDRRIRACTPAPGAWTTFRGERVRLGPVEPAPADDSGPLAAGELARSAAGPAAGTGTGPVRLGTLQRAGRRALPPDDWWRGARPLPGERFE